MFQSGTCRISTQVAIRSDLQKLQQVMLLLCRSYNNHNYSSSRGNSDRRNSQHNQRNDNLNRSNNLHNSSLHRINDRNNVTERVRGGERDWTCPSCYHTNFARRSVCQRCDTPKSTGHSTGGRRTWHERSADPRDKRKQRQLLRKERERDEDWVDHSLLEFKFMKPDEALIALSRKLKSCHTRGKLRQARTVWQYDFLITLRIL